MSKKDSAVTAEELESYFFSIPRDTTVTCKFGKLCRIRSLYAEVLIDGQDPKVRGCRYVHKCPLWASHSLLRTKEENKS